MPPVGFEPTIPASARPQTYALDRAAAVIGQPGGSIQFSYVTPKDLIRISASSRLFLSGNIRDRLLQYILTYNS
jgi:hypothetical protein